MKLCNICTLITAVPHYTSEVAYLFMTVTNAVDVAVMLYSKLSNIHALVDALIPHSFEVAYSFMASNTQTAATMLYLKLYII